MTGEQFYVTGGTLRPDAPSYVERQADKDLWEGLLRGEFCYVLTPRQMGKSSLMVRTVKRLRAEGVAVAVLDLTAIGQNLTILQWYDGLIARLGQQLNLEDELEEFWRDQGDLGPLQKWLTALETVVLARIPGKVVLFVDEIDVVRSLPFSTDEFFAAIRECYNRRSREPAFARLAFGLLGVATPTDLIRDPRMTPFNIGRRIELQDFNASEAAPLARGLGTDEKNASLLLGRVLHWTGGHPYLTQRLCRTLYETLCPPTAKDDCPVPAPPIWPTLEMVDKAANALFLCRQARDRDDNLIFVRERILRSEVDVTGLLYLYRKVLQGQPVADDETNPLVSVLRLSGITRGDDGSLHVRNRIYGEVFDIKWIQVNMPQAELRRQRKAGRRGILIGFGIAVILLLIYLFVSPVLSRNKEARMAYRTADRLAAAYSKVQTYQDRFDTTYSIGLGGSVVPATASGSLMFERPNRMSLNLKNGLLTPPVDVRFQTDGAMVWASLPSQNQFQVFTNTRPRAAFDLPAALTQKLGPLRALPLYRLLLNPTAAEHFLKDAQNVRYVRATELSGQPVHVLAWGHSPRAFFSGIGLTNISTDRNLIPITAWVSSSNYFVLQLKVDLSHWARELIGAAPAIPVTALIINESHKSIQTSELPVFTNRFDVVPGVEDRQVAQLDLPEVDLASLASRERQFLKLIPPRVPFSPRTLIDLSDFYNAALSQTWHNPSAGNNSLEALTPGILQLGGTVFDVRGIVQLSGIELERAGGHFPQQISGIKIGQRCRDLHFLHATGWKHSDGSQIGTFVVHYADGEEVNIPIVYGDDVRDWNAASDSSTKVRRGTTVWTSTSTKTRWPVRLFKMTWLNPLPKMEIVTLDYVSSMTPSAPFLIAVTAEP